MMGLYLGAPIMNLLDIYKELTPKKNALPS